MEVYQEALTELGHVHRAGVLITSHFKAVALEQPLGQEGQMEPAFQGQGRAEELPRAGIQLPGHWWSCLFRSRSLTLAHGAPLSPRGRVTWVSAGAFPGIVQRKLLYLRRRTPTRLGTERGGDRARHPPPHTHQTLRHTLLGPFCPPAVGVFSPQLLLLPAGAPPPLRTQWPPCLVLLQALCPVCHLPAFPWSCTLPPVQAGWPRLCRLVRLRLSV